MKRQFSAERLDVRAFAEDAAELAGSIPLGSLQRLAAEARGPVEGRQVDWSAQGELRNAGHVQPDVWLHLQAQALLPMTCQRCLEPVDVPLEVDRAFRFVADEDTAAAEDDEAEEDLLAISRTFDLPGLIEDELLMEVPVVPRHDVCPHAVPLSVADPGFEEAAAPEHPFAGLRVLKTDRS
ncbi:MAG: YceD family protein [Ramlibacter sp.]